MDTGSNGQMLQTNVEAIAEVKVVTQGYQAEYGRASGLQISASPRAARTSSAARSTTSSAIPTGTRTAGRTSGTAIRSRCRSRRDWGYTIGGPVGKPGGANKLFFFYAHEYRPRTTGGGIRPFPCADRARARAATSRRRIDNNGALFNLIRDASTGLPVHRCRSHGLLPGRRRARPDSSRTGFIRTASTS